MEAKRLVTNAPKVVKAINFAEFILELNDFGEIRISHNYNPTTFVLEMGNVTSFATAFNQIFDHWVKMKTEKGD